MVCYGCQCFLDVCDGLVTLSAMALRSDKSVSVANEVLVRDLQNLLHVSRDLVPKAYVH